MTTAFAPPFTPAGDVDVQLRGPGFALLTPAALAALSHITPAVLASWQQVWAHLPPDAHLRDGGHYRRRRHGCFVIDAQSVASVPQRAHWQPLAYNALHGGFERWFEPLEPALAQSPEWLALLRGLARHADALRGAQTWSVEAHAFRIDTAGGIGRPTPEGAHRDGVDLVAVMLLARQGVKGGETRVFDAAGPQGQRFTLTEPLSCLLLDDAKVIHETTPIQPLDANSPGWRDTLVLTYRAGGFQGP